MPGPSSIWASAITALLVGPLALAACAGASSSGPEERPVSEAEPTAAPAGEGGAAPAATAEATAAPSASASAAQPEASASASASASAAPAAGVPVAIEITEPKFTSGDVPKAFAALEKQNKKLKACIDDAGGLSGATGSIELQFLVRAAGVAEGVDVVKMKGVPDAAKKCLIAALQKKTIGTPSTDPVGVNVVLKLTPAK